MKDCSAVYNIIGGQEVYLLRVKGLKRIGHGSKECVNSSFDWLTGRKTRDILYAVEIALSRVVEGTGPMIPGNRSLATVVPNPAAAQTAGR